MLKTFLPKAFRTEKAPSNHGYFNLESWIQARIQDGTINLGSSDSNGIYGGSGTIDTTSADVVATLIGNNHFTVESNEGGTLLSIGSTNATLSTSNSDVYISADAEGGINISTNSGGLDLSLTTGLIYTDSQETPTGIIYADDYSATYVSRSLVDKAYVDSQVAGIPQTIDTNLIVSIEGGESSLTFSLTSGDNFNVGDLAGGLTFDTPRAYLQTTFNTVSIGVYDGVPETINSFVKVDAAGDILISTATSINMTGVIQLTPFSDTTRNALTPVAGMLIFNIDPTTPEFQVYNGTAWVALTTQAVG